MRDASDETGVPEEGAPGVSEPGGGTIRVVVPNAGGAPGASEDGAGRPEVGIGCPGGGKMMLVVVTTTDDSAGGGAAYELEAAGGFSVTVTVTAGPQAQVAGQHVSWCDAKYGKALQPVINSHSMAATASASAATTKSL
jgi:hypothetical protein